MQTDLPAYFTAPETLWILAVAVLVLMAVGAAALLSVVRALRRRELARQYWITSYSRQKVEGHSRDWYAQQARDLALRGGIAMLDEMIRGAGVLISVLEAMHLRHRAYSKAAELTLKDMDRLYHDQKGRLHLQDLANLYKMEADRYLAAARQLEQAPSGALAVESLAAVQEEGTPQAAA